MTAVTLRAGTHDDLRVWQGLSLKLFESDGRFDPNFNNAWPFGEAAVDYFRSTVDEGVVLLAYQGERPVGFIDGMLQDKNATATVLRAEIYQIYVEVNVRRSGVGRSLVGGFAQWCADRGAKEIVVGVFKANAEAVAFYGSLGLSPWIVRLNGLTDVVQGHVRPEVRF